MNDLNRRYYSGTQTNNRYLRFYAGKYFMAEAGKYCSEGTLISTVNECKLASSEIGLNFFDERDVDGQPEGCSYYVSGYSQFNVRPDPLRVLQIPDFGGICSGDSKLFQFSIQITHNKI